MLQFNIYARYKSHDNATLSYLEDALRHFHPFKDVFLLGRAGTMAMASANALRTELVKKRKVDNETHGDSWMRSKKRHKMNAWREIISHEIVISKELDGNFNFLKIHLMSYCAKHSWQYRALQHYTAERHEQEHIMNLKDSWYASNHNLNNLP
jgi:hypothetical protein